MTQSQRMSVLETCVSTSSGFVISWAILWMLAGSLGWSTSVGRNTGVTLVFTAASLVRGYWVRRLFNRIHHRIEKRVLS